jgi:hypothetical protein
MKFHMIEMGFEHLKHIDQETGYQCDQCADRAERGGL